jgi:hypothetical protein
MSRPYTPRGMPRHFLENAPAIVKAGVLDLIAIKPAAPLDFDVVLREGATVQEVTGLDFGADGARGCHFFLKAHEMAAYRARNRRKRVAWSDLPEATQNALIAYLTPDLEA